MKSIELLSAKLSGRIDFSKCAPSKSYLHREMICSYLAGQTMPEGVSDDTWATYYALRDIDNPDKVIDARDSASTLRFLIPLVLHMGGRTFRVGDSLKKRPLSDYDCIKTARITSCDGFVDVRGSLECGDFVPEGNISSQFVSGLMFALPLLSGDSTISFSHELQSRGYAEMTRQTLLRYGIDIKERNGSYYVPGNKLYTPCNPASIEGDWSYAAFFAAANALGADIELAGLNPDSLQPDRQITELIGRDKIDVSSCPDLFPALCVCACGKQGTTQIYNAGRQRYKECDRLEAMAQELRILGADITEYGDGVVIHGTPKMRGGIVNSRGDHRVAMALTIAALCLCDGITIIDDAECVKKSAPHFFEHIEKLRNGESI